MTDEHEQLARSLKACKPSPMSPGLRRAIIEDTDYCESVEYRIRAPFALVAAAAVVFGVLGLLAGIKIGHGQVPLATGTPQPVDQIVTPIPTRQTEPGAQSALILLSAFNNDTLDDALNSGQDQEGPPPDPTPAFTARRGVEG